MKQQPIETLELIRGWGFSTVEIAVFLDWSAARLHEELERHELRVCSLAGPPLHPDGKCKYYVDWAIEYLEIFGTSNLLLQSSAESFRENQEDLWENAYDEIADLLAEVTRDLAKSDIRVRYHCYPYDFKLIDGKALVSRLFARDDVLDTLALQLDTYWLNYGQTDPDAYASLPVDSVHLNERDEHGCCCVLGTHEEKCEKYVRPLIHREKPIDWILENDPSDEKALSEDKRMTDTLKKCFAQWPEFWRRLAQPAQDQVSQEIP
jgi:sugar phosphate isomerase/epimerase